MVAINPIPIANDVLRCLFPGICLGELTGDPFGSRMSGHAQLHDHATSVLEYQQSI